jgi:hypothetical protein
MEDKKPSAEDIFNKHEKGALTDKAAISEKDSIEAIFDKHARSKTKPTLIGVASQRVLPSENEYYQGMVYGSDPQTHYAQRQGAWAEAGNATAQVVRNFVPGLMGSIGAMDPRDWFAGLNENEEEIGNALTRFANAWREETNQDIFPIYEQDQGKHLNLGSSEWWFKNGSSVVGSAAEFAAMGFGLGSLLTKGLTASKWLSTIDAATGAVKLNTAGQAIGVGTNAFLLNQAESVLEATQVYDQELQKNMQLVNQGKLTEHEAKVNAASAAGHTVNLNRMNILLNLSGVSAIMKGARGSRNIIKSLSLPQQLALEGGQEYLEEVVNFYATNRGLEKGEAIRTGKPYTGATVSKFVDDALSAEGIEAGFLGAFGGVAQTGFIGAVNKLRGANKEEQQWQQKQQSYLTELDNYRKTNKLSNLRDSGIAAAEMKDLLTHRATLEKQLQDDYAAGKPADNNVIAELQKTNNAIQMSQLHFNFQMGTTEYLEKAYQDIAALSDEEAAKQGYTGRELDPKSPAYFKTVATNMLNNLHTMEKVYNKTQSKLNSLDLFRLKAETLETEKQLAQFTKLESEALSDAQKAVARLERQGLQGFSGVIDVNRLSEPGYETQVGDVNNPEVIQKRKELIQIAKSLPEVQALEKARELKNQAQEEIDFKEELYAELASQKYQDQLWKEREVQKAADKKAIDKLQSDIKQAQQDVAAATVKAAEQQKRVVESYTQTVKAEGVSDEDTLTLQAAATKALNTKIGTEIAYTPEEEILISKYPEVFQNYLTIIQAPVIPGPYVKPNQMVYTESDNLGIPQEYTALSNSQLSPTFKVGKDTGKPVKAGNKLLYANNVMAWLARSYKTLSNKVLADVDNNLNQELKDPSILDARTLKVGDAVTLKVDPTGLVVVKDANGAEVTKPWNEVEADFSNDFQGQINLAPIGIYRKGEDIPVGYVHLPSWISISTVQGDNAVIAEEKKKISRIRAAVLNAGEKGINSTISQRTYGKLFIDAEKKPQPVSTNLQDPSLTFTVLYQNEFLASDKTQADVDKIVVNHTPEAPLKNGFTYVLVPIEKNSDPKLTKHWAIPLLINKITPEIVESVAKASEIYLRALDGTITPEDDLVAEAILAVQKDVREKGSPVNFDIRTPEGIRNYTELFIYNHTKADQGGSDPHMSLSSYFVQRAQSLPGDYFAHEFSNKGLFFGRGKHGLTAKTNMDTYMRQWREHLANRFQHTNLRFLNNGTVKLPIIKTDNTVAELAPGNTYLEYLKQHAWQTNVIGHNIAEPGKPANFVYTIQQIIEFDTTPFDIKPVVTAAPEATEAKAEKVETAEEIEKANQAALDHMFEDLPAFVGSLSSPEVASGLPGPLLVHESAYQNIRSAYTLPPSPDFDNATLRSLLSFWGTSILNHFNKAAANDLSGNQQRALVNELLGALKQQQTERLTLSPETKSYKIAKYTVDNWDTIENLIKYSLQRDFGFSLRKYKFEDLDEEEQTRVKALEEIERDPNDISNTEEAKSLKEKWSIESLERDPAKGLSARFRRFLGSIVNPTKTFLVAPKVNENFRPVSLYRTLSAILADTDANFNTMMQVLNQWSERQGFEYLRTIKDALMKADEQIKSEFVVTMSKHYVNMKHLYILTKPSQVTTKIYEGIIRDDNSNAKTEVVKSRWYHDLFYSDIAATYTGEDLRENRAVYDKEVIQKLVKQYEEDLLTAELKQPDNKNKARVNVNDFDIASWLEASGINLSPAAYQELKLHGTAFNPARKAKGYASHYHRMFYADRGEFMLIYKFLKNKVLATDGDVFIENLPLTSESGVHRLAAFDARFNAEAHSHSHQSGNKSVFSYADNKYLLDRARQLGAVGDQADLVLLNQLANSSFAGRHSWDLKQMLRWDDVTQDFVRDEEGNVIFNKDSDFNKNFKVSYVALSSLIEKGTPTSSENALEDLDAQQHEILKFMMFQNRATGPQKGLRRAQLFHMTLSNKNTMLMFEKSIPPISLNPEGEISNNTAELLFENIVMPEVQRMLDYTDNHNIDNYQFGHKLFYFFPELNNKPELFNIEPDGTKTIRRDVHTNTATRKIILDEIKKAITNEVKFKLQEWEDLGLLKRNKEGKVAKLDYVDGKYNNWVKDKIIAQRKNLVEMQAQEKAGKVESTVSVSEVANYAATEMAVAYMLHDVNLFQLITTDPATQYKGNPLGNPVEQVYSTFDNISKRLGGEISPGRDLAAEEHASYKLAVIQDIHLPSQAFKKYVELFADNPESAEAYRFINATDAAEFITLPEKLRFMKESAKLTDEQIKQLDNIAAKYQSGVNALKAGKDPSKYDLNLQELGLVLQVDKPIMVGTRVDNNVESKVYVKSAAFTLIPQLVRGTELEKLMSMMSDPENPVDRLAMLSAVKLGAPRATKKVFDNEGNFIVGSTLEPGVDIFTMPRKFLRLQQETPLKTTTEISRVSQASKQAFLNILHVPGFRLPGSEKEFTGRELYENNYIKRYEFLYKHSYDKLLEDLKATTDASGNITVDPKKLNKLIQDELVTRGYPIHDLEALDIEQLESGEWRFKMPIWAAAKSGKLEAFLNSIVSNRILKQKFNGYSFVLGPEAGFKFNPKTVTAKDASGKKLKKGIVTEVAGLDAATTNQILFTDKFKGELKPALENKGYHQVILPWKYKESLSKYIDPETKKLSSDFDPELLKLFGMRIPNQGPNSTAALEVVGFFPPEAGDVMVAPRDFVTQMGSDFDIDKLYTYMPHYFNRDGKLYKVKHPDENNETATKSEIAYVQNQILNIHLAINTNMDPRVQKQLATPLSTLDLKDIAGSIQSALQARASKEAATSERVSWHDLSPASGSYQSHKYQNSVIASKAISAFAVQNTFNAVAQTVEDGLSLVKSWPSENKPKIKYSHVTFGDERFRGQKNLSRTTSLKTGTFISSHISAMLSAALDDEKEQILGKIHVNDKNLSLVNFLLQAGFELNTIANFVSQDIIVEYTKQLGIHNNNSERALNAVMKQARFAFDDVLFQNRGLEPGEKVASKIPAKITDAELKANPDKYEQFYDYDDTEATHPVRAKFWRLYNSGADEMFEYIAQGPEKTDYKYAQYALLQKFIDLNRNEASVLRSLQSMSNVDSKGLGANMFQSILQQEDIEKLGDPLGIKIENAGKMFGEFLSIEENKANEAALLEEGYIKGNNFYFKPTSIPGFAFAYGVMTNNKLWKKHFPYNTNEVLLAVKEISDTMSSGASTLFTKAEQFKKIFREIKNFVYTDNAITRADIEATRRELLYDYIVKEATKTTPEVKHLSLASILYAAKKSPATSKLFRENSFLNNLYSEGQPDFKKPRVVMFRQPPDDETTNRDIFSDVENLVINPVDLGEFNGIKYNTRMFIEQLLTAANISMTSAPQLNLIQYIPTRLLVQSGIAESLHTYEWEKVSQKAIGEPAVVTTQYFQHFPQLTLAVNLSKVENPVYGHDALTDEEVNLGLDQEDVYTAALKRQANILKFTLEPVGFQPMFLHATSGDKILLFKLTDRSVGEYTRIPTLLNSGNSNTHEFNANVEVARSLYPGNNPPAYTVPVAIAGRMGLPVKQQPTAEALTKKKAAQVDQILSAYGLRNEEYDLSKAELDTVLERIFETSKNAGNRLTAAWLRTLVTADKNQFIVNFKVANIGDRRGTAAVSSKGHIQVAINPNRIDPEHGKPGLEETILHELTHSVTKLAIMQGRDSGVTGELSAQQRRAYKNLNKLYEEYKAKYQTGKQGQDLYDNMAKGVISKKDYTAFYDYVYPGKNLEEFVVAIMQRPALRARLNELVYNEETGETFWDRIKQILNHLLKALGVDPGSTAGKAIRDIMFISEQGNALFENPGLSIPLTIIPGGDNVITKKQFGNPDRSTRSFTKQYTPEEITTLADDEVFVFGSNPLGINGNPKKRTGGAALIALEAGWVNQGEKLDNRFAKSQKAFGITTVTAPGKKRSKKPGEILNGIREMFEAARSLPNKKFLVTKIGTRNAGYEVSEIKALFEKLEQEIPDNVILPFEYDPRPDPELGLGERSSGMDWEAYSKMQELKQDQEEATPKVSGIAEDGSQIMDDEMNKFFEGLNSEDMPAFYGTSRRKRGQKKKVSASLEKVNALLAERRSNINQLYKREKDIRTELEKPGLTDDQRLALQKRRLKVFANIEEVEADILKISAVANTEDLVKIGEADMAKMLTQLADVNKLDFRDFHILTLKLNVWKNFGSNFLSPAELEIPAIVQMFEKIVSAAVTVEAKLLKAKQGMIYNWAQNVAKKQIDPQMLWAAAKDIGWAAGQTLSLDNANHELLQVIFQHIKHAESFAREELNTVTDEIKKLLDAVKSKEAITGKNFSNFFETDEAGNITGNLIRAYSPEYMSKKHNLIKTMQDLGHAGDRKNALATRKKLNDLIKKNEVFFDVRKLVKLPGYESLFTADNGKLEAELRSILGDINYDEFLAKAVNRFKDYELHAELKKEELDDEFASDPVKAAAKFQEWLNYNSLPDYLDFMQDTANKSSKSVSRGWAFAMSVPKLKGESGESLYNEKYLTLQQDADVAALHRYTLHLLSKMRKYMPSNLTGEFASNSLPAIQKGTWETLTTEGMVAASVSLLDKLKMGLTSADTSELLYGADESGRVLNIKMQTLKTRINKLVDSKKKEYLRKNNKAADEAQVAEFKKQAAEEIQKQNSTDLPYLLATYAGALINYHHKTKIEDSVRIAEELFVSVVKDPEVTADGTPKMRVYPGGVTIPEFKREAHVNQKRMLKYALDRFWQLPKDVELPSETKLYTSAEKKNLKSLQAEVDTYTTQIADLNTQLEQLKTGTEGLPVEQAEEQVKKIKEVQDKLDLTKNKLDEVNAEVKALGQNLSGSGVVNTLIQYLIVKGLGWNIFGGVTNLGVGTMSNMIEASGGRWFNEKEMLAAYRIALNSTLKSGSLGAIQTDTAKKLSKLMKEWDILKTITKDQFRDPSPTENALDILHWAQIYKTTEFMNQAPVLVAMMKHYKLQDVSGKDSNLWEAYGETGTWNSAKFGDIDSIFDVNKRAEFKASVDKAIKNIHGNYDRVSEVAAKGSSLGKLLTVFRNWMFEGFKNRWESESVDVVDNVIRKGRYWSYKGSSMGLGLAGIGTMILPGVGTALGAGIGLALGSKFKDSSRFKSEFSNTSAFEELEWTTKYLIRKLSFGTVFNKVNLEERFTETDARNLRKNMTELSFLLYVTGLMMVLKHLADGEDDDEKKGYLMYSLNVMHRLQQDLGFYANPVSTQAILRDPIPAVGIVTDSFNFIKHSAGYIADPDSDVIPTGRFAGESRLERSTYKLVPGLRVIPTTKNLLEQELPSY